MKRWLEGNGNSFGEHLGPLRRFIEKSVGRPWDKVYSEICAHLRPTSTIQQHVRDHLWDFVALRVRETDGELYYALRWGWFRPLRGSWVPFYVCPKSGILKENPRRGRRRREAPEPRPLMIEIDEHVQLHQVGGIWYEVKLTPKYSGQRDAVTGEDAFEVDSQKVYGRAGVYGCWKRQLGRKELKSHGVKNTPGA
jgi:hypothetical protein